MPKVTVLFEDQAAGPIKEFGPGNLLAACVADAARVDVYSIKPRTPTGPPTR